MQEFLQTIIKEAGKLAKEYFDAGGVAHRAKTHLGDLVTDADISVSNFLVAEIQKKYPEHHIHSEEMTDDVNPGAEYEWVIDPIDGTRNFAGGIPLWCQIIAVIKGGQPYLAAVYNPIGNQLFFAQAGKGATMNDKPIQVNSVDSIAHAFACFNRCGDTVGPYGSHIDRYKKACTRLINDTNVWIRQFSTMLDACYVASGAVDFWCQNAGLDWDYLAPALICREAGAMVTDSDGAPWKRGRQDMIIANSKLHPKVIEFFQS